MRIPNPRLSNSSKIFLFRRNSKPGPVVARLCQAGIFRLQRREATVKGHTTGQTSVLISPIPYCRKLCNSGPSYRLGSKQR